jgi:hypothetical protein
MKRKIIVFILAAAPSAIALIAAGFVSFASGSPYSPGPDGSAATVSARMAPPARPRSAPRTHRWVAPSSATRAASYPFEKAGDRRAGRTARRGSARAAGAASGR